MCSDEKDGGESDEASIDSAAAAQGSNAGYELFGTVSVGGLIGYFLDKWLGVTPWCMVAGLLLGGIAGFVSLIRLGNRPFKIARTNKTKKTNPTVSVTKEDRRS